MDNETIKLVAQLTIRARKVVGLIDINRLTRDAEYQDEIFKKTDEVAEEELLLISLALRTKLGSFNMVESQAVAYEEVAPPVVTAISKYKFGARC